MNTRPRRLANRNSAARLLLLSWASVGIAASLAHPISFVLLLLAATLVMAALCEFVGFGAEGAWSRTLVRRGAVHLVLQVFFATAMVAVITAPLFWLVRGGALPAALSLSAVSALALLGLARVWPAFALPYLWDDAFPRDQSGSWMWRAAQRSLRFAAHLSRRNDRFFSHALPASLGQMIVFASASMLVTVANAWPLPWRLGAFALHGLIVLPAAQMLLINRCLRLMVTDRQGRRSRRGERAPPAAPPQGAPDGLGLLELIDAGHSAEAIAALEDGRVDNSPDLGRAVVLACSKGDVAVLRALLLAGAPLDGSAGSPLLAALGCARGDERQAELVMTLLANGAEVRCADEGGAGPLHLAGEHCGAAVAAVLVDGGAALDVLDAHNRSPLARACAHGNWSFASQLIKSGASLHPAGLPPLLLAADPQGDDPKGVEMLLQRRVTVDVAGPLGRTPLLVATLAGRVNIATLLLASGADVDLADARGTTPLMEAARSGRTGLLDLLLSHGPQLDAQDNLGRTALAIACAARHGSRAVIERLLAAGADPTIRDNAGRTPADHASASGRWHLVQALTKDAETESGESTPKGGVHGNSDHLLDALRFGHWKRVDDYHGIAGTWPHSALAEMFSELVDDGHERARDWLFNQGLTVDSALPDGRLLADALLDGLPASAPALAHAWRRGAAVNGCGLVARLLASASAVSDTAFSALRGVAGNMIDDGADVFGPDARGDHALHHAVRLGLDDILDQLLSAGVDPNQRNGRGCTAIQMAMQGDPAAALRCLPSLLRWGADPQARSATGETALGTALAAGHQDLAWWLDWSGWQLPGRRLRSDDLCTAAAAGDVAAVERLLAIGLSIDARDGRGATALLHALGTGHRDVVDFLLDHGADPLQVTETGATSLSAAIHAGDTQMLAMLLERGVDVNHRVEGGPTALMVAAALGALPLVALLLEKGAGVDAVDGCGMSALHGAAQDAFRSNDAKRSCALLGQLLDAGADVTALNADGQDALSLVLGSAAAPGTECHAAVLAQVVSFMIARGAPLGTVDRRGVSALHACAMHGLLGCARILVDAGADIAVVDTLGRTAADVAALLGYVDVAAELRGGHGGVPGARRTLRQRATPD